MMMADESNLFRLPHGGENGGSPVVPSRHRPAGDPASTAFQYAALIDRIHDLTVLDRIGPPGRLDYDELQDMRLDQIIEILYKIRLAWARNTLDEQPELLIELSARAFQCYRELGVVPKTSAG